MKLTAKLAYSQIIKNRSRSIWTLAGIALSTAMITAVFGFAASGDLMLRTMMGDNDFYTGLYHATLIGMSVIFTAIIVAASVIVISNAFRVSAGERISQFGILKSVGTTKKQIAETIVYEGIFLCGIGIPAGIILGLLVNLSGIQIANYFLTILNNPDNDPLELRFILSWQAILLSVTVAFATVLLSAWLPARKAAKTPAIDAIRGAGEIKVKAKHVRANWLVGKLFGFEGTLASKSLKRSRRNFRATVISLTASIVMLIVVGDFGALLGRATAGFYQDVDANVAVQFYSTDRSVYDEESGTTERIFTTVDSNLANDIAVGMRDYGNADVFGVGSNGGSSRTILAPEMLTQKMWELYDSVGYDSSEPIDITVTLLAVDAESYAKLCQRAGVPLGSNILVNQATWYHFEGGREIFVPIAFENQTLNLWSDYGDDSLDLTLHGQLVGSDIPGEISRATGTVTVIVPHIEALSYTWFADAEDADGFSTFAFALAQEMLDFDESLGRMSVLNVDAALRQARATVNLVMTFVYGFVIMLTLIGLTNVISTISTNIRSRSREFAILRSVGTTDGGIKRMLNLESVLCSMKSLVFGLPLGIVGSYLLYLALDMPLEMPYKLPWIPIILCTLGVFAITWATMQHAASRLRGGNIVETIRGIG